MTGLLTTLILIIFSFHSFALTTQKEIFKMEEILPDIQNLMIQGQNPRKLLVVFDIDNTILSSTKYLGSDAWATWKSAQIKKYDPSRFGDFLDWLGILFQLSPMKLTERNTPYIIKQLQKKGVAVMALTSRSTPFRAPTLRELKKQGVDLSLTAPGKPIGGEFTPKSFKRNLSYSEGVMMVSGQHKGQALTYLLRKFYGKNIPFSQILFIDDHAKNTNRVFETFSPSPIGIITYRYGKEDRSVREFHKSPGHKSWATKELKVLRETLLRIFKTAPGMI